MQLEHSQYTEAHFENHSASLSGSKQSQDFYEEWLNPQFPLAFVLSLVPTDSVTWLFSLS